MAVLTTDTDIFGAVGVSDPSTFVPNIAFHREIDFSKIDGGCTNGVNHEFIPVPKGFVMTGIVIEEMEKCDGTNITVKAKGDSATIGAGAVAVGDGDGLAFYAGALTKAFSADDMLCIVMGSDAKEGKIGVAIVGYCASEETFATAQCPAWRAPLQTMDNVSGGQMDPREHTCADHPETT